MRKCCGFPSFKNPCTWGLSWRSCARGRAIEWEWGRERERERDHCAGNLCKHFLDARQWNLCETLIINYSICFCCCCRCCCDYSIIRLCMPCNVAARSLISFSFLSFWCFLLLENWNASRKFCRICITCVTSSAARRRVGGVRCLLHMQLFHQLWQSVTVSVQLVKHVQGARPGQARLGLNIDTRQNAQNRTRFPSPRLLVKGG